MCPSLSLSLFKKIVSGMPSYVTRVWSSEIDADLSGDEFNDPFEKLNSNFFS